MVKQPNFRLPQGLKFLEIIIPLLAETDDRLGDLERVRTHLITQKVFIRQSTPDNPGYYDVVFNACESNETSSEEEGEREREDDVVGGEDDEDMQPGDEGEGEGEDNVVEGEKDKEIALGRIRKMRKRKMRQFMCVNLRICVPEYVSADWHPKTPFHVKPENRTDHIEFRGLWYNMNFVDCYDALMTMVDHLIVDERKTRQQGKDGAEDTDSFHDPPDLMREYFWEDGGFYRG